MLLIPLLWRLAVPLGLMDKPNPRKLHGQPIPRIGGCGIVAGTLVAVVITAPIAPVTASFLIGGVVLLAFGIWDDAAELTPPMKLAGQVLAAAIVVWYGDLWVQHLPFVTAFEIPWWIGQPFTVFAIVGVINALNVSDGLDGLAAGESLLSLTALACLGLLAADPVLVVTASAVLGGTLGFLRFNSHPARIFMGDTGSQFLGFAIAYLVVLATQHSDPALSGALPLLVIGLPLADIFAAVWRRRSKGMGSFEASQDHIHHRLLNIGFAHYEVVILIYSVQAICVTLAILLRYDSDIVVALAYLAVVATVFVGLRLAENRGWKLVTPEHHGLDRFLRYLRRDSWIRVLPLRAVQVLMFGYLLFGAVAALSVSRDLAIVSAVLLVVLLAEAASRKADFVMHRLALYTASVFVAYLMLREPPELIRLYPFVELGYFMLLALFVALTVRLADERAFRTTPSDYLTLFLLLVVGTLAGARPGSELALTMIVRVVILLYGCEVIVTHIQNNSRRLVTCAAALTLAVLALRGELLGTLVI